MIRRGIGVTVWATLHGFAPHWKDDDMAITPHAIGNRVELITLTGLLIGFLSLMSCSLPPAPPDPWPACMGNHSTQGMTGFDEQNVYNPKCLQQMEQPAKPPSPASSNP